MSTFKWFKYRIFTTSWHLVFHSQDVKLSAWHSILLSVTQGPLIFPFSCTAPVSSNYYGGKCILAVLYYIWLHFWSSWKRKKTLGANCISFWWFSTCTCTLQKPCISFYGPTMFLKRIGAFISSSWHCKASVCCDSPQSVQLHSPY